MARELTLYLRRLKSMQEELLETALLRPKGKSGFDYGKVCGEYLGLKRAEQLLEESIEEVANDEDK